MCVTSKETLKDMVNVDKPSNTGNVLGNIIASGVHNGVALA